LPLAPELQVETPSLSHTGASPLAVLHSLSCPHPRLSLHKPRVSLAGFLLFLDFLTLEDGNDTLSRNIGKGLPLDAALYPRRAQISKIHEVIFTLTISVHVSMDMPSSSGDIK
jgi:hypothetical protein